MTTQREQFEKWDNNGITEYTQDIHSVEYYSSIYGIEMTPLYTKIKE